MINKKLLFKKRPYGLPDENTWELTEEKLPDLLEGEILIEHEYISLDPAMRGWMNEARSYIKPIEIGEVMRAGSVGKVIKQSGKTRFNIGDHVSGWGGVQTHCITNGENLIKVDPSKSNLSTYLGVLGMPGMTAYFGILEEAKIKEGDVVLVSGAAGAVGSLVGQIAKIKGCTVIGIAGGEKKCNYIKDNLGFDDSIDYKKGNVIKEIKKKCPNGIDVYFDNVGGEILDAALIFLRRNARVILCGAISQYNNKESIKGPKNYLSLLVNRASIKGMIVFDYVHKYEKAISEISGWIEEGKITVNEDIYEGIDNFRSIFLKLFNGDKMGKLILKIKPK
jgi:NADPH-dependent curcumin reductase CurA